MASQFDDDRFYDTLNRSGDNYRADRYRMAEEQASHTREMGQIYGQMLPSAINAGMKGADWRQNRDINNQAYENRAAEAGRAEENQGFKRAGEGRAAESWDIQKPMYQDQAANSRLTLDRARRAEAADTAPVGSEEAQEVGYKGTLPLTHEGLQRLRSDQRDTIGVDTAKQQLQNARQAAGATAQQMALTAQTLQNQQYTFEAQKAASELDNIYSLKNPQQQAAALEDWRTRYTSKMLSPESLTNMAAGGGARREATMAQTQANNVASTKLIYGSAIQEAQAMTEKLAAVQKLAEDAKTYEQSAIAGGLWENPTAKDARNNAAATLTALGKHGAADQVRTGGLASARGLLDEHAQQQAATTVAEFDNWYARQDDKVQQLPEVKRAYQQAQQLKGAQQGSPELRKLPSLVGQGGAGGQNVQANGMFLTGGKVPAASQGNMQIPGGMPPPQVAPNYFTQPPQPQPQQQAPAPAPMPQQAQPVHYRPDQVQQGQHPMQTDPYGLKKGSRSGGAAYGSR